MPLEIIAKRKTEPECVTRHTQLVALRVVEIRPDRLRPADRDNPDAKVHVGDILVVLPNSYASGISVLNASKKMMLEPRWYDNGGILALRAYDVAQIIVTSDNTPAPVV